MDQAQLYIPLPEPIPAVSPAPTPEPFKFYEPPKWTYCSCVDFAKYLTGHFDGTTYGPANKIKPNTDTPEIGDWVLTYEGLGHAAVIVGIEASGSLDLLEANWKPCDKSSRSLDPDDKRIRGFFKP